MSELPREIPRGGQAPPGGKSAVSAWPGAVAVFVLALAVFGYRLGDEPHFVDESAYCLQSYYFPLYLSGAWHDPAWLEYPAYDLPPFPKYLIGAALSLDGQKLPTAADSRAWYMNTSTRFGPPARLTAARVPTVLVGALGCAAVYGIGVLVSGRSVGFVSSLLLMANPLYRMLSRRAMSDVPCEAFLQLAFFFSLWTWKGLLSGASPRRAVTGAAGSAVGAGVSLLSKMSGVLYFPVVAAWALLGIFSPTSWERKGAFVAHVGIAGVLTVALYLAMNPYLLAHPSTRLPEQLASIGEKSLVNRVRLLFKLRLTVAADQQRMFPHNAVVTLPDKLKTSVVQGFGRFGPFGPGHSDSTIRFDWKQDSGALIWVPLVLLGVVWSAWSGWTQFNLGLPPVGWALLLQFLVTFAVVALYLPMAWDRYFLPLQPSSALLASGALTGGWRVAARSVSVGRRS